MTGFFYFHEGDRIRGAYWFWRAISANVQQERPRPMTRPLLSRLDAQGLPNIARDHNLILRGNRDGFHNDLHR